MMEKGRRITWWESVGSVDLWRIPSDVVEALVSHFRADDDPPDFAALGIIVPENTEELEKLLAYPEDNN